MNKASDILNSLTPSMGAAGAREVAMAAVEKGHAENDLSPAAAIDNDVITEVIKSLAEASAVAPAGTTAVQIAHSAAGAAADPDIDVAVAQLDGKVDGLASKVDQLTVYLNKSFAATARILDLMQKGVGTVDKRVLDQGVQVLELAKSLNARQGPKAATGRVTAEPNLQDRAASEEVAVTGKELANRVHLQQAIQVEIQKSAALEQQTPGSQKERMKRLSEASLMLTRPVSSEAIANHVQIQLPA